MRLLDPDSLFGRLILRLMDLIILNLLWIVTSLPIVTLGASTTAMYHVTMQMAMEEDSRIFKTYFRWFFHCFWRSTRLFLVAAAVGAFIAFDFWAAAQLDSVLGMVSMALIIASAYLYLVLVSHLFPALAYFDGGVWDAVKTGFRFTIANGIHGVWIVGLNLLVPALAWFATPAFIQTSFLWIAVGVALIAYFISLRMAAVFDPERAKLARRKEL